MQAAVMAAATAARPGIVSNVIAFMARVPYLDEEKFQHTRQFANIKKAYQDFLCSIIK